jgi:uncharacterized protein (DUF1778 family)
MPYISLRVSEEEKAIIRQYAELHGISLSSAIKNVFFEKVDQDFIIESIRQLKENGDSEEIISQEMMTEVMRNVFGNL